MHQIKRLPSAGLVVSVLALLLTPVVPIMAQPAPLWGDLEPGPYPVGFTTIEKYDYSRTFRPEKDYFGEPLEVESARPVQVCYWYPAVETPDQIPVVYSEYNFPYPTDAGFLDLLGVLQNRELGMMFFFMQNNQGIVLTSMSIDCYAVRDATPAEGPFPLIVYHNDPRSGFGQNAVLCEYLASRGFVVATTHAVGAADVAVSAAESDFQSVVRDKEVVTAAMRELPNVDPDLFGLLGLGGGASTALIHQMSNYTVDAVATIQADFLTAEGFEALRGRTGYELLRMQAPWLQLYAENPEQPPDLAVMDSLKYTKRYSTHLSTVSPREITTYSLLAATLVPDTARPFEAVSRGYNTICKFVGEFFEASLNGNATNQAWIDGGFDPADATMTVADPDPVPPTEAQFVAIIRSHGVERANEICEQFDLTNPENPIMSAVNLNVIGYQFLQQGRTDDALIVFTWAKDAYPTTANAYDSYGEALAAAGDLEGAIKSYSHALEILDDDASIDENFRQRLREGIPPIIEGLEQRLAEGSGTESQGE